jgi:hypothetical protein
MKTTVSRTDMRMFIGRLAWHEDICKSHLLREQFKEIKMSVPLRLLDEDDS